MPLPSFQGGPIRQHPGGQREAVAAYQAAAAAFLAGDDPEAERQLDRWLASWPDSRLRANAYLLRGQLELAAGRLPEAESDLRVAGALGTEEVKGRVRLAGANTAAS